MTIQGMDNFSIYGTTAALLLNGIYAEASSTSLVADPDGVSPGRVLRLGFPAAGQGILRFPMPDGADDTVGVALRLWLDRLPDTSDMHPTMISWRSGANVGLFSIDVSTTGQLQLRTGNYNGAIVATTPGPVITANGWWHIEARLFSDATGNIEVRVEGIPVIDYDADTSAAVCAQVSVINDPTGGGAGVIMYIKDYVVWNGAGTYNNDFLGSVLVHSLAPVSDVQLNWTPSTGATGWPILDNVPPNDAQYISAGTPAPNPYICEVSDLPIEVTSVKALMSVVRARKTDGGDGSLQVSAISQGDIVSGANRPITTAMTYWRDVFETDPDTGLPWSPAAVNLVQLQLDRTDS